MATQCNNVITAVMCNYHLCVSPQTKIPGKKSESESVLLLLNQVDLFGKNYAQLL